jgi:hypothetical protein
MPRNRGCPFEPPPTYAQLRDEAPVAPIHMWNGNPAWLITRFDDVRAVLRDPRFSADSGKPGFPEYTPGLAELSRGWLTQMDAPEHTRLRKLVTPEFSVKRMEAMRPRIAEIIDQLIDEMLDQPQPYDFVSFTLKVPSMVICEFLGAPYDDHDLVFETVRRCFNHNTPRDEARSAATAFIEYMDRLATSKEREPADDVLGRLAMHVQSGDLTHEELVDMAAFLVIAGFDTTGNTIALGTVALLEHPEQLADLVADPALVPDAVEEILRYTSIMQGGRRRAAVADVEVAGQLIHAGEGVVASQDSASRDGGAFPYPTRFDLRRKARHHVAFGFGPHACAGASLARVELQAVFSRLFGRIPTLQLAVPVEELRFKEDSQIYGLYECPISW